MSTSESLSGDFLPCCRLITIFVAVLGVFGAESMCFLFLCFVYFEGRGMCFRFLVLFTFEESGFRTLPTSIDRRA
ncbi:hypothetical protein GQ43DRAFT_122229 [Delitschia confertaspora ATCC 74209]|uniref:Uncharacterized protein n=1 Tax=Delitschia confertaspora ATCC 74209 TaxID=1513339 RepID=A0A9P4JUV7_9PLEO|nr:hypothetical protein GQ43DRAFT_122229 [Delitschia confertaspora ATCC 74209]